MLAAIRLKGLIKLRSSFRSKWPKEISKLKIESICLLETALKLMIGIEDNQWLANATNLISKIRTLKANSRFI